MGSTLRYGRTAIGQSDAAPGEGGYPLGATQASEASVASAASSGVQVANGASMSSGPREDGLTTTQNTITATAHNKADEGASSDAAVVTPSVATPYKPVSTADGLPTITAARGAYAAGTSSRGSTLRYGRTAIGRSNAASGEGAYSLRATQASEASVVSAASSGVQVANGASMSSGPREDSLTTTQNTITATAKDKAEEGASNDAAVVTPSVATPYLPVSNADGLPKITAARGAYAAGTSSRGSTLRYGRTESGGIKSGPGEGVYTVGATEASEASVTSAASLGVRVANGASMSSGPREDGLTATQNTITTTAQDKAEEGASNDAAVVTPSAATPYLHVSNADGLPTITAARGAYAAGTSSRGSTLRYGRTESGGIKSRPGEGVYTVGGTEASEASVTSAASLGVRVANGASMSSELREGGLTTARNNITAMALDAAKEGAAGETAAVKPSVATAYLRVSTADGQSAITAASGASAAGTSAMGSTLRYGRTAVGRSNDAPVEGAYPLGATHASGASVASAANSGVRVANPASISSALREGGLTTTRNTITATAQDKVEEGASNDAAAVKPSVATAYLPASTADGPSATTAASGASAAGTSAMGSSLRYGRTAVGRSNAAPGEGAYPLGATQASGASVASAESSGARVAKPASISSALREGGLTTTRNTITAAAHDMAKEGAAGEAGLVKPSVATAYIPASTADGPSAIIAASGASLAGTSAMGSTLRYARTAIGRSNAAPAEAAYPLGATQASEASVASAVSSEVQVANGASMSSGTREDGLTTTQNTITTTAQDKAEEGASNDAAVVTPSVTTPYLPVSNADGLPTITAARGAYADGTSRGSTLRYGRAESGGIESGPGEGVYTVGGTEGSEASVTSAASLGVRVANGASMSSDLREGGLTTTRNTITAMALDAAKEGAAGETAAVKPSVATAYLPVSTADGPSAITAASGASAAGTSAMGSTLRYGRTAVRRSNAAPVEGAYPLGATQASGASVASAASLGIRVANPASISSALREGGLTTTRNTITATAQDKAEEGASNDAAVVTPSVATPYLTVSNADGLPTITAARGAYAAGTTSRGSNLRYGRAEIGGIKSGPGEGVYTLGATEASGASVASAVSSEVQVANGASMSSGPREDGLTTTQNTITATAQDKAEEGASSNAAVATPSVATPYLPVTTADGHPTITAARGAYASGTSSRGSTLRYGRTESGGIKSGPGERAYPLGATEASEASVASAAISGVRVSTAASISSELREGGLTTTRNTITAAAHDMAKERAAGEAGLVKPSVATAYIPASTADDSSAIIAASGASLAGTSAMGSTLRYGRTAIGRSNAAPAEAAYPLGATQASEASVASAASSGVRVANAASISSGLREGGLTATRNTITATAHDMVKEGAAGEAALVKPSVATAYIPASTADGSSAIIAASGAAQAGTSALGSTLRYGRTAIGRSNAAPAEAAYPLGATQASEASVASAVSSEVQVANGASMSSGPRDGGLRTTQNTITAMAQDNAEEGASSDAAVVTPSVATPYLPVSNADGLPTITAARGAYAAGTSSRGSTLRSGPGEGVYTVGGTEASEASVTSAASLGVRVANGASMSSDRREGGLTTTRNTITAMALDAAKEGAAGEIAAVKPSVATAYLPFSTADGRSAITAASGASAVGTSAMGSTLRYGRTAVGRSNAAPVEGAYPLGATQASGASVASAVSSEVQVANGASMSSGPREDGLTTTQNTITATAQDKAEEGASSDAAVVTPSVATPYLPVSTADGLPTITAARGAYAAGTSSRGSTLRYGSTESGGIKSGPGEGAYPLGATEASEASVAFAASSGIQVANGASMSSGPREDGLTTTQNTITTTAQDKADEGASNDAAVVTPSVATPYLRVSNADGLRTITAARGAYAAGTSMGSTLRHGRTESGGIKSGPGEGVYTLGATEASGASVASAVSSEVQVANGASMSSGPREDGLTTTQNTITTTTQDKAEEGASSDAAVVTPSVATPYLTVTTAGGLPTITAARGAYAAGTSSRGSTLRYGRTESGGIKSDRGGVYTLGATEASGASVASAVSSQVQVANGASMSSGPQEDGLTTTQNTITATAQDKVEEGASNDAAVVTPSVATPYLPVSNADGLRTITAARGAYAAGTSMGSTLRHGRTESGGIKSGPGEGAYPLGETEASEASVAFAASSGIQVANGASMSSGPREDGLTTTQNTITTTAQDKAEEGASNDAAVVTPSVPTPYLRVSNTDGLPTITAARGAYAAGTSSRGSTLRYGRTESGGIESGPGEGVYTVGGTEASEASVTSAASLGVRVANPASISSALRESGLRTTRNTITATAQDNAEEGASNDAAVVTPSVATPYLTVSNADGLPTITAARGAYAAGTPSRGSTLRYGRTEIGGIKSGPGGVYTLGATDASGASVASAVSSEVQVANGASMSSGPREDGLTTTQNTITATAQDKAEEGASGDAAVVTPSVATPYLPVTTADGLPTITAARGAYAAGTSSRGSTLRYGRTESGGIKSGPGERVYTLGATEASGASVASAVSSEVQVANGASMSSGHREDGLTTTQNTITETAQDKAEEGASGDGAIVTPSVATPYLLVTTADGLPTITAARGAYAAGTSSRGSTLRYGRTESGGIKSGPGEGAYRLGATEASEASVASAASSGVRVSNAASISSELREGGLTTTRNTITAAAHDMAKEGAAGEAGLVKPSLATAYLPVSTADGPSAITAASGASAAGTSAMVSSLRYGRTAIGRSNAAPAEAVYPLGATQASEASVASAESSGARVANPASISSALREGGLTTTRNTITAAAHDMAKEGAAGEAGLVKPSVATAYIPASTADGSSAIIAASGASLAGTEAMGSTLRYGRTAIGRSNAAPAEAAYPLGATQASEASVASAVSSEVQVANGASMSSGPRTEGLTTTQNTITATAQDKAEEGASSDAAVVTPSVATPYLPVSTADGLPTITAARGAYAAGTSSRGSTLRYGRTESGGIKSGPGEGAYPLGATEASEASVAFAASSGIQVANGASMSSEPREDGLTTTQNTITTTAQDKADEGASNDAAVVTPSVATPYLPVSNADGLPTITAARGAYAAGTSRGSTLRHGRTESGGIKSGPGEGAYPLGETEASEASVAFAASSGIQVANGASMSSEPREDGLTTTQNTITTTAQDKAEEADGPSAITAASGASAAGTSAMGSTLRHGRTAVGRSNAAPVEGAYPLGATHASGASVASAASSGVRVANPASISSALREGGLRTTRNTITATAQDKAEEGASNDAAVVTPSVATPYLTVSNADGLPTITAARGAYAAGTPSRGSTLRYGRTEIGGIKSGPGGVYTLGATDASGASVASAVSSEVQVANGASMSSGPREDGLTTTQNTITATAQDKAEEGASGDAAVVTPSVATPYLPVSTADGLPTITAARGAYAAGTSSRGSTLRYGRTESGGIKSGPGERVYTLGATEASGASVASAVSSEVQVANGASMSSGPREDGLTTTQNTITETAQDKAEEGASGDAAVVTPSVATPYLPVTTADGLPTITAARGAYAAGTSSRGSTLRYGRTESGGIKSGPGERVYTLGATEASGASVASAVSSEVQVANGASMSSGPREDGLTTTQNTITETAQDKAEEGASGDAAVVTPSVATPYLPVTTADGLPTRTAARGAYAAGTSSRGSTLRYGRTESGGIKSGPGEGAYRLGATEASEASVASAASSGVRVSNAASISSELREGGLTTTRNTITAADGPSAITAASGASAAGTSAMVSSLRYGRTAIRRSNAAPAEAAYPLGATQASEASVASAVSSGARVANPASISSALREGGLTTTRNTITAAAHDMAKEGAAGEAGLVKPSVATAYIPASTADGSSAIIAASGASLAGTEAMGSTLRYGRTAIGRSNAAPAEAAYPLGATQASEASVASAVSSEVQVANGASMSSGPRTEGLTTTQNTITATAQDKAEEGASSDAAVVTPSVATPYLPVSTADGLPTITAARGAYAAGTSSRGSTLRYGRTESGGIKSGPGEGAYPLGATEASEASVAFAASSGIQVANGASMSSEPREDGLTTTQNTITTTAQDKAEEGASNDAAVVTPSVPTPYLRVSNTDGPSAITAASGASAAGTSAMGSTLRHRRTAVGRSNAAPVEGAYPLGATHASGASVASAASSGVRVANPASISSALREGGLRTTRNTITATAQDKAEEGASNDAAVVTPSVATPYLTVSNADGLPTITAARGAYAAGTPSRGSTLRYGRTEIGGIKSGPGGVYTLGATDASGASVASAVSSEVQVANGASMSSGPREDGLTTTQNTITATAQDKAEEGASGDAAVVTPSVATPYLPVTTADGLPTITAARGAYAAGTSSRGSTLRYGRTESGGIKSGPGERVYTLGATEASGASVASAVSSEVQVANGASMSSGPREDGLTTTQNTITETAQDKAEEGASGDAAVVTPSVATPYLPVTTADGLPTITAARGAYAAGTSSRGSTLRYGRTESGGIKSGPGERVYTLGATEASGASVASAVSSDVQVANGASMSSGPREDGLTTTQNTITETAQDKAEEGASGDAAVVTPSVATPYLPVTTADGLPTRTAARGAYAAGTSSRGSTLRYGRTESGGIKSGPGEGAYRLGATEASEASVASAASSGVRVSNAASISSELREGGLTTTRNTITAADGPSAITAASGASAAGTSAMVSSLRYGRTAIRRSNAAPAEAAYPLGATQASEASVASAVSSEVQVANGASMSSGPRTDGLTTTQNTITATAQDKAEEGASSDAAVVTPSVATPYLPVSTADGLPTITAARGAYAAGHHQGLNSKIRKDRKWRNKIRTRRRSIPIRSNTKLQKHQWPSQQVREYKLPTELRCPQDLEKTA
ncbi:hypothetical protein V5799_010505 [Amblyomma americanum]|uniref:Uncharacterized protein n=1 Tax=Amblyomma americanum TaxID=6943 RepID=A0AAQ4EKI5_AMBAM